MKTETSPILVLFHVPEPSWLYHAVRTLGMYKELDFTKEGDIQSHAHEAMKTACYRLLKQAEDASGLTEDVERNFTELFRKWERSQQWQNFLIKQSNPHFPETV